MNVLNARFISLAFAGALSLSTTLARGGDNDPAAHPVPSAQAQQGQPSPSAQPGAAAPVATSDEPPGTEPEDGPETIGQTNTPIEVRIIVGSPAAAAAPTATAATAPQQPAPATAQPAQPAQPAQSAATAIASEDAPLPTTAPVAPAHTESPTVAPSTAHVWVPGYYGWNGSSYVWVAGSWQLPPSPRYHRYVPAHWQLRRHHRFGHVGHIARRHARGRVYVFVPARWHR